jgi:hypothetical protein
MAYMNDSASGQDLSAGVSHSETLSGLFANMVLQQTSMTLMLLGKTPHPESGKSLHDPEAARMFIDQLEMLEVKTRGNLTPEEAGLLKQSLMTVRMAFVEAVDEADKTPSRPEQSAPAGEPAKTAAPDQPAPPPAGSPAPDEESRKKFSKKY